MEVYWQEIYQSLKANDKIVVAAIVSHYGSTPRTSGSKMIINVDGRCRGTIGGGAVEADVVQSALRLFFSENSVLKSYNLNASAGFPDMDMICGGQLQVLIEFISRNEHSIDMYRRLSEAAEKGKSGFLLGRLGKIGNTENLIVDRSVRFEDDIWRGALHVTSALQDYLKGQNPPRKNTSSLFIVDDHQYVLDPVISPKTVYLIGAGHVAKEIAPLAQRASFRIIVIDDRAEFVDSVRFPCADGVSVCTDCSKPLAGFDVDNNSYIIIITRGHGFDKEALAQALGTGAGYIGMIGSRKKRDQIYKALQEEGFALSQLARVHCPIGLPIGAETPFEIAVSIIAEVIRHRADASSA